LGKFIKNTMKNNSKTNIKKFNKEFLSAFKQSSKSIHTTDLEDDALRKNAYGFRNLDNDEETNQRFTDAHFKILIRKTQIDTMYNIISVIIAMDSKYAYAVVQPDDCRIFVRWYLLESMEESDYEGQIVTEGTFLRAKDLE
jgi:nitrogen-specific signal transduction histidine kinase